MEMHNEGNKKERVEEENSQRQGNNRANMRTKEKTQQEVDEVKRERGWMK